MPKIISGIKEIDGFSNKQPKLPDSGGKILRTKSSGIMRGVGGPAPAQDQGGGSYTASAVHFDGASSLHIASLTASGDDTGFFSASVWYKLTSSPSDQIFTVDPENFYTSYGYAPGDADPVTAKQFVLFLNDATGSTTGLNGNTSYVPISTWHNILVSAKTDFSSGNKIIQMFTDDISDLAAFADNASSFTMTFNGKSFWFNDDGGDHFVTGDFADIWIAPGQFIDFSVEANRRKFIDANGKPVDLGGDGSTPTGTAPAIFFSGDATTFATNGGTGGAFTLVGSLTDASTSPSD